MKKLFLALLAIVVASAAYLGFWPVAVRAVAWDAPAAPGYVGPHAPNAKLAGLNLISLVAESGPEHVVLGRDGKLYAAMARKPFLRELTLRLPRALWPLPRPYGHVIAFDESGRIVADLQYPSGAYPQTTGVTETADRLYIQNLHLGVLGWLKR